MSTRPTRATPSATEPVPFELRLARPDELEAVGRLTVEVYVGDGYMDAADDYVLELADTPTRAREAELWVAVTGDGDLLGTVTFCPVGSGFREIGRADEGEFRMLGVAPKARGRGVGLALVDLCVRRSRELGYAGVRMSTMSRMTAAHRVYGRLGFERAPDDDWSPTPGVELLAYSARFEP